eukprot:gnl/MRDRNA2_/MRDRNA2_64810_c0_seq1.p1 gnl/MRDRNA2_/MRDRNA2_64810_c0~~gnl/MRDRNA2_/MRDRNA2_64810_c0_seq1.p1  ORF type:complete len:208 (+),score=27.79 gnl/MRDRNA2_/MRDRNA2_64810_c0_seq1:98-721(+)
MECVVGSGSPTGHAGWVWKRSKFLHTFRRRYCVLRGHKLAFYKRPGDTQPTEVIDLQRKRCRLIEGVWDGRMGAVAEDLVDPQSGPALFTLEASHPSNRTFEADFFFKRQLVCRCPSVEDRQTWVQSLMLGEHAPVDLIRNSGSTLAGDHVDDQARTEAGACGVCLEELIDVDGDVYKLHCGHHFCWSCLEQWAAMKRVCPQCKALF